MGSDRGLREYHEGMVPAPWQVIFITLIVDSQNRTARFLRS
jgi:hypothetical protein